MLKTLKHIVPVGVRVAMKKAGHRALDVVRPVTAPRVPSRAQTFIGGGDFVGVGEGFLQILKEEGLTPEKNVLDVGCGQGRMARPMVGWLRGNYHGFDIDEAGVAWCAREYADAPNFHFTHANVFNARYNVGGDVAAKYFRFPFDDDSFDFVFLTSVFTHMFKDDVETYLSEIARVAKPGARVLISWYLYENGAPSGVMDFRFKVDAVTRTTLKQNPEAALAFDLDWVRGLYAKHGLTIEQIDRGSWANGAGRMGVQDLVVGRVV